MDRFAILLDDLGGLINVPLHPDVKGACRLSINGQIHLQLQDEGDKDRVLVATFICDIPPGKFRENILKETLKENNIYPRLGTFAYSERNNKLAFFSYVYYPGLRGDNLADFLALFLEKVFSWKTAIETGQLPQRSQTLHKTGPSIFDVQRS
jgi:hypothetical protein